MKKKKVLQTAAAIAMAAVLATGFAGCGSTDAAQNAAVQTESAQTADTAASENDTETAEETSTDAAETEAGEADASAETDAAAEESSAETENAAGILSKEDITTTETVSDDADTSHALMADGETASYSGLLVTKTGDADGDEADFYGTNAAVFATNGANLTITDSIVETDGAHANAVFSYGEGTVLNISNSVIETTSNCSGGIMVTGGGTLNAENLTIHTTGNSSAAIRSDRGGGTMNVTGGSYTTDGTGSPVIYSTADVTVSDALMESTASQGVVVEGKNSVTLNDVTLIADNNTKNSDKSDWYQAVMIYQSMSGDAAEGEASFTMTGGSLTNKNGDIFFVNNTVATITLEDVDIVNEDEEGVFLRAAAAGWGSEGSNGGQVNLTAINQTIDGDLLVDDVSALNLYLTEDSTLTGAVNPENEGEVYVEIEEGSTWTLTADSYVSGLTCAADAIDLNGYHLYVGGEEYQEGTESEGEALTLTSGTSSDMGGEGMSGGAPGEMSEGSMSGGAPGDGQTPPEKPDQEGGPQGSGSTPPAKPES